MSSRTRLVAVAVQHIIGTSGNSSLNHFSSLKLGRKSCPHSDMPNHCKVSIAPCWDTFPSSTLLTMCFINSNPRQLFLLVDNAQMLPKMVHLAVFWRHVQKPGQWVAALEVIQNVVLGGRRSCAVDRLNTNARSAKSRDLVIHQGQQRRYDDCDSKVHDGRKLETQTLSKPGSCLEEDIMSLQSSRNHFSLDWSF